VFGEGLAAYRLHMTSPGRLPPFGSLLRDRRRAAGLTQEELAAKARVGVRTLRDLEAARTARPQRSTVDLLAAALELDETELKDFVVASRGWPSAAGIPRPRTHLAVLASWRLLTRGEQESLCWLTVFQGRWTLDLATGLLAGRTGDDVAALLDHLVELGLVSTAPDRGRSRFWLREAVQLVVAERAATMANLAAARDRHAVVVAGTAAEAAKQVSAAEMSAKGPSPEVLEDLSADLQAAVQHLRGHDRDAARDLEAQIAAWRRAGN
jgi:transcriptional regulator with XRE-family HTH domain